MFESKKTQFLIEFLDRTQKSTASWQKFINQLRQKPAEGWFLSCVGKTQILIESLDRTQKSPASRQKKFS